MSVASDREKDLPLIPVGDINDSGIVEGDEGLWSIPPSKNVMFLDADKVLPPIKVESMLSEEEMSRLHELWNGAALSARAHRMRRRELNPSPHRIPAPIFIPELENIPLTPSAPSGDSSIARTETRKRWGFLSARPFSETQEVEKNAPNALGKLRAMAQDRLKKKLRYAKSTPNLGHQAAPFGQGVTSLPAVHIPAEATPKDRGATSGPRDGTSPATPGAVLQQEDTDKNAIYFTIDSDWRASRGSVSFESITPIPDNLTFSGRPDSPLLHRHHSLDQLSFAAQKVTVVESSEVDARDEVLELIDELYTYLEL